jgi:DNA-binding NarL/FixJ family response regulator
MDTQVQNDPVTFKRSGDRAAPSRQAVLMAEALRVAWIDSHRLTRECMMSAFVTLHPSLALVPYASVDDCIAAADSDTLDLVVYHSHALGAALCDDIATLQRAVERRPIVLLSDAGEANQMGAIRDALRSGANGYVCTRTSSMSMAFASLLFVQAGGTFAPLELLLTEDAGTALDREPTAADRLTGRQMNVLAQVKQGKPNKAIARELGMSESAVKVHIRSIMRKMGAANRTQAAFAAMDVLDDDEGSAKHGTSVMGAGPLARHGADEDTDGRDG